LDVKDPVPLILVPGYGGIKPAYRELRKAVVSNGKPAVTFRPPRSQEKFAALHPRHFLHPERLLAQAVLAITKDLLSVDGDSNDYEQVDTAGHSMGGPAVVNAALVRPERFRTVTAMAAAGLDGHSLNDMRQRAPAVFRDEILPSFRDIKVRKDYRAVRHMAHYVARNPWRTAAEGLAVGSGDIRYKVTEIGRLGVKTAALQFASDRFFPVDGVAAHSAGRFDLFRVFPDPDANHMWPQLQPEAVGDELVDIVDTLQSFE
jgi:pimeloyl-ACP methyl ester carboxylesterase